MQTESKPMQDKVIRPEALINPVTQSGDIAPIINKAAGDLSSVRSSPDWVKRFHENFGDDNGYHPVGNIIPFLRQTIAEVIESLPDTYDLNMGGDYKVFFEQFKQQLRDKYL